MRSIPANVDLKTDAALTERQVHRFDTEQKTKSKEYKRVVASGFPVALEQEFKRLKALGKVTGTLSAFIVRSVAAEIERAQRDG